MTENLTLLLSTRTKGASSSRAVVVVGRTLNFQRTRAASRMPVDRLRVRSNGLRLVLNHVVYGMLRAAGAAGASGAVKS